jgi:hypothetical protein
MSNEKRIIEIPRNLQLGDYFYQIKARPLDEHLGKKSNSELEFYDVDPTMVVDLKFDPGKPKNILINNRISLPADGALEYEDGLLLNEKDALDAVRSLYKKMETKAKAVVAKAEEELKSLQSAREIFENKKSLNKKGARNVVVVEGDSSDENAE